MARRKRPKPQVRAIETTDAVVTTTTWLGYKLPPELPPEPRRRHCPKCGWGPASTTHTSNGGDRATSPPGKYTFECRSCATGDGPTRWQEDVA